MFNRDGVQNWSTLFGENFGKKKQESKDIQALSPNYSTNSTNKKITEKSAQASNYWNLFLEWNGWSSLHIHTEQRLDK